jgi:hypothetical protein
MSEQTMSEGAFALIDCLGFRGIWKRTDHNLLLEKLRSIVQQVQPQIIKGIPFDLLRRKFIINASLLSDSVAISLRYKDSDVPKTTNKEKEKKKDRKKSYEKNYLVWLICASTIKILDLYLEDEPNLILRGNITYGKYANEGNFIVGPAVDEAVGNMEVAQGAFVWLDPTAEEMYKHCVETTKKTIKILSRTHNDDELLRGSKLALASPILVDSYDMPLKGGERLRCPVLNPFAFHKTEKNRQAIVRGYLKALYGSRIDVLLKRQNTMNFLIEAAKARAAYIAETQDFFDSVEAQ